MQGDHDPVKRTFSEGQLSQHPFSFYLLSFFLSFGANCSPEICDPLGTDLKDLYMFFGSYHRNASHFLPGDDKFCSPAVHEKKTANYVRHSCPWPLSFGLLLHRTVISEAEAGGRSSSILFIPNLDHICQLKISLFGREKKFNIKSQEGAVTKPTCGLFADIRETTSQGIRGPPVAKKAPENKHRIDVPVLVRRRLRELGSVGVGP